MGISFFHFFCHLTKLIDDRFVNRSGGVASVRLNLSCWYPGKNFHNLIDIGDRVDMELLFFYRGNHIII